MATLEDPSKLTPLVELSQALATSDIRAVLPRVLEILAEAFGAVSGAITLAEDEGGALRLEASRGLSRQAVERARYKAGEGVTGRVLKSGKAVVVPKVSQEPLFLDRTGVMREHRRSKGELTFFCVPLFVDGKAVGALSLTTPYLAERDFDRDTKLLQIAASMVGMAMKVARLVAADRQRLLEENRQLREELQERYELRNLIGNSHAMQRVYERVGQAAPATTTVMIRGESGTGKELVAREVHRLSRRAEHPLIRVNCASVPRELYESEFFGHVKGAFTGAIKDRAGRFEAADSGTLLLDEVGEVPFALQSKFLRVLQEKQYERVGEEKTRTVDVRIIAASNRDLKKDAEEGRFRQDFYYRLNVFPIEVPPLRERKEDIPMLAAHFLKQAARRLRLPPPRLTDANARLLQSYDWPGNVRELQNATERALILAQKGLLQFDLIAAGLGAPPPPPPPSGNGTEPPILTEAEWRQRERENTHAALVKSGWRIHGEHGAAELLGLKPTTLISRMKKVGLKRPASAEQRT